MVAQAPFRQILPFRVRARLVNPCPSDAAPPVPCDARECQQVLWPVVAKGADDGFDFVAGFVGTPLGVNRRRILRDNRARFGLSTTER